MITEKTQEDILQHITELVRNQVAVRQGEREGTMFDMEKDLTVLSLYGLISFFDEDNFIEILKGGFYCG